MPLETTFRFTETSDVARMVWDLFDLCILRNTFAFAEDKSFAGICIQDLEMRIKSWYLERWALAWN
jgi:hypothetical protein